jgi:hypothetical protein
MEDFDKCVRGMYVQILPLDISTFAEYVDH